MYGVGLYFSANSTKSLNYSQGGLWSVGVDEICYMFLVDVAMGREYLATSSGNGKKTDTIPVGLRLGTQRLMMNKLFTELLKLIFVIWLTFLTRRNL